MYILTLLTFRREVKNQCGPNIFTAGIYSQTTGGFLDTQLIRVDSILRIFVHALISKVTMQSNIKQRYKNIDKNKNAYWPRYLKDK